VRSPSGESVDGDLSRLVDSDGVDVESLDGEARERLNLGHDVRIPFPETVLYRSEL